MIRKIVISILTSKPIWIWGVTFSILWLILGVFVFSQGIPKEFYLYYAGVIVSALIVWVYTNLISNLSNNFILSSASLYYAFKFTKLTPKKYLLYYVASISIITLIISGIMLILATLLFTMRFNTLIFPNNILGFLGIIVLSSIFIILFSILLALVIPPKYLQLSSLIPQLLYFALVLGQIFVGYPYLITYTSPFNDMQLLLFQEYTGYNPPLSFVNPFQQFLNPDYLLVSLFSWDSVLYFLDVIFLGKIKPRNIEEARQF
ncbi:hypothetical protein [Saccharolobus caldissimus]|uniref:Uncharacterized protein n=1 Tax=Saccharolobus caldissimus TaxID=1702097 RepID=A0AAQ4CQY9_9CREN|nr:hypothetical protein [Saccharolobus caldissimus]BDB98220.1 hypothetical protein SACC_12370 [Saccharolobus caldissimus]